MLFTRDIYLASSGTQEMELHTEADALKAQYTKRGV